MKKAFFFIGCICLLVSCNETKTPKEVSKDFISSLYVLDYGNAGTMASAETKDLLAKKEVMPLEPDAAKRKLDNIRQSLQLDSLQETISEGTAKVQNGVISMDLKKEASNWKVVVNSNLVDEVINRLEKEAYVKNKWEELAKAYDSRNGVIKQYITYLQNKGPLSAEATALQAAVNGIPAGSFYTKDQLYLFVQKQDAVAGMTEKAIVPSFSANSDLSTNYIIQINNAENNIAAAKSAYNEAALKVKSAIYQTLPVK